MQPSRVYYGALQFPSHFRFLHSFSDTLATYESASRSTLSIALRNISSAQARKKTIGYRRDSRSRLHLLSILHDRPTDRRLVLRTVGLTSMFTAAITPHNSRANLCASRQNSTNEMFSWGSVKQNHTWYMWGCILRIS